MVDGRTLLLYLPAMLAITLAPGADTLYIVAAALRSGWRGGVFGALGIVAGGFVHIGFAAVGLSALLVKSAVAFTILKYAGAAYLIYLGVRTLIARESVIPDAPSPLTEQSPVRIFAQGFLTNVLNPKVALFVLAFLPQFVSPARGSIWSQLVELGALWYAAGFIYLSAVGILVGRLRRFHSPSAIVKKAFRYVTASIFVGLGIKVAV
jgi:threonine/homoserine/homoserine lactone efflux protein